MTPLPASAASTALARASPRLVAHGPPRPGAPPQHHQHQQRQRRRSRANAVDARAPLTVRASAAAPASSSSSPSSPKNNNAAFLCVLALAGAALIPPLQELGGAAERAYQAAGAPLRLLPGRQQRSGRRRAPPGRTAEAVAQLLLALLSVGPFAALAFVGVATEAITTATPAGASLALTAAAAVLLPAYLRLALLLCGCRPSSAAGQACMLSASALRLLALVKVAVAALAAAPEARGAWASAAAAAAAMVAAGGGNSGAAGWQQLPSALLSLLHPSVLLQAVLVPLAVGVWALASFARPARGWGGRRRSDEEARSLKSGGVARAG